MGRLSVLALVCIPVLVTAADPAPIQREIRIARNTRVKVKLVFRKGILVEGAHLPKNLIKIPGASGWIPFERLAPEGRKLALKALWPDDAWEKEAIRHHVRYPEHESPWLFATLFMGHGQHYDRLMEVNPRNPEKVRKGDVWRIPRTLLLPELGGTLRVAPDRVQPEEDLEDDARTAAYRAMLTFDQDKDGRYAAYRLRKGEALYSSVVMRYTDRVDAKEVNELALEIAKRSGIADVHGIPAGTIIKIPVAHLAAPFQEEGAPALAEEREVQAEVRRTPRVDAGPALRDVAVVLDPGHGGIDVGAMAHGVWESDFVYDIAMRVRRLLENTEATSSVTMRYPGVGLKSRDHITAPTREADILTKPVFPNDGERPNAVSVHLRWVLANDLIASHAQKGDARKTLFISLHADSLHPSARGTMVYVPGAAAVPASFTVAGARMPKVAELKRGGTVAFSARERLQGEARSRLFAEEFLKRLRAAKLPIHDNRPIRSLIRRGGKSFVPAVIRYSNAATKVLVEVCNLQNEEDAQNLKDPEYREAYAEALVKAIRAYFGK